MPSIARLSRLAATLTVPVLLVFLCGPALAQTVGEGGFVTGTAKDAWEKWNTALASMLARDGDTADMMFEDLLSLDPSPLRIALLADRSIKRNVNAGGVLLLEQDAEADALEGAGKQVYDLLVAGREQMNEADDGWYFASVGRFGIANANFQALLASDPDPVALLEFADRVPKRHEILVQLAGHAVIGESVTEILALLREGETLIKADPTRVKQNIERLDGPPRAYENAVANLKDSGEYAVPFMVQSLRDPAQKNKTRVILKTLPQVGRTALNPLVIALQMDDQTTQRYLVRAAGTIGYWQAVPYLLKIRENPDTLTELREAVDVALSDLARAGVEIDPAAGPAEAFYRLAAQYYEDRASLAADPRLDSANVWYWRDGMLVNIKVPTAIFNEVMCMRCCEEALLLNPDLKPALALWLAANFRREAQLAADATDYTRSENFPSAAYFAQSAGPDYCLMALAEAVDDGDPAVALGAIEALRKTAGAASLMSGPSDRLPLGEALSFADRMVRIRAALALGHAAPREQFHNSQNLMPVLSEAVMLFGGARNALVIDPQEQSANASTAALRSLGYEAVAADSLYPGLEMARNELPGLEVILLASDIAEPDVAQAIEQLRGEFRFASVPVVIVAKASQSEMAAALARGDHRVGTVVENPDAESLGREIATVAHAVGATAITPERGLELSLEAIDVLRAFGQSQNEQFRLEDAQPALLAALNADDPILRQTAADALGYLGNAEAQEAIANVALNATEAEELRVAMFAAVANAAQRRGNYLSDDIVQQLITVTESEENMVIRTAASQALGALNLPGNPASVIIRNQYGG